MVGVLGSRQFTSLLGQKLGVPSLTPNLTTLQHRGRLWPVVSSLIPMPHPHSLFSVLATMVPASTERKPKSELGMVSGF